VGEVTDTGRMELFWHGEKCADIPVDPVSEEAPILDRPTKRPDYLQDIEDILLEDFTYTHNQDAFIKLITSMEVVDKAWIYEQYDSMVQTNTIKKGVSVFPTPTIATVGVNEDQNRVLSSSFQANNSVLYLIGQTKHEFGGSLYLKELYNVVGGKMPKIDYDAELALWNLIIEANKKDLLLCAKDCSSGGIAIALAKMSAKSRIGCNVGIDTIDERDIFSESFSRAIVEVKPQNCDTFQEMAKDLKITKIGTTGGEHFTCNDIVLSLDQLCAYYFDTFKDVIEL